jgi:hypothetical protein
LLQSPIGKPNTRTSNIQEQAEIGLRWCTNGVQSWGLIVDDSLGAGIGSSSWEMTCVRGALPLWGLVDISAGVVARVVGDEREVVFEGGCGDPGVGYSCRASIATHAVGRFSPPVAHQAAHQLIDPYTPTSQ